MNPQPNQGGGPPYGSPSSNTSSRSNQSARRVSGPSLASVSDNVLLLLNEVRTLRDEVRAVNDTVNRTDSHVAYLERLQGRFNNLDKYLRRQVNSTNTNTRIVTTNVTNICEATQNIVQENQHNINHMKQLVFAVKNSTDEIKFNCAKRKCDENNPPSWNKKVTGNEISYSELQSLSSSFAQSMNSAQPLPATKKPSTNDNDNRVFTLPPPQEESSDEDAVVEPSVETDKNDSESNNNA